MNRSLYWIIFGIFKVGLFIYLSQLTICSAPDRALGNFAVASGDTFSYTGAMENYVKEGEYYFYNGNEKVFAGRLPHYAIPYYFLRQFFDQKLSYDLLVFLQLGVEIIASIFFLILISKLFNSNLVFLCGYLFLLFSSNWTNFSYYVSPESFSISFLVCFLFFYQDYLRTRSKRNLLLSGVFLAFLVVLKSYYILIYLFIGVEFINYHKIAKFRLLNITRDTAIVSFVLLALLTPWIVRNHILHNKFIPLQINASAGYNYSESEFAFRRFVTAWGGDIIHWEKTSAGCYFFHLENNECEFQFPSYVWAGNYSPSDVEEVKNMFVGLKGNYVKEKDIEIAKRFDDFTVSFINQNPFRYYIISPLVLLKRFLVNSGSYFLPIHKANNCFSTFQMPIKLFQSMLYWLSITVGLLGVWLFAIREKTNLIYLFIILMILIIFPSILRIVEWRYLRTIQPIFYIGIIYSANYIIGFIKTQKH